MTMAKQRNQATTQQMTTWQNIKMTIARTQDVTIKHQGDNTRIQQEPSMTKQHDEIMTRRQDSKMSTYLLRALVPCVKSHFLSHDPKTPFTMVKMWSR
jgi:hypothetical protein